VECEIQDGSRDGQRNEDKLQDRLSAAAVALDRLVILLWHVRAARGNRIMGELIDKIADRLLGVKTHLEGICTNERATEDPSGQPRDVVLFERFQRRQRNLRGGGDLSQPNATVLTGALHPGSEIATSLHHTHLLSFETTLP
jgi:hypothetical protein